MNETLRLFIALDLPAEVKALLGELQDQLRQHTTAVRWSEPGGTHLTLKFLGSVQHGQVDAVIDGLQQVASGHAPFQLATTDLGVFPNIKRPRVVWLGIGGAVAALSQLQAAVEGAIAPLGYPTEQRSFSPHLTLGRSPKDPSPNDLATIRQAVSQTKALRTVRWNVSEVVLMRSELRPGGARYTSVAHARLDDQS